MTDAVGWDLKQRGAHLRHEVGGSSASIHDGHSAEVHLPDDGPGLGKRVVHDHIEQRLQERACVVKSVLGQKEGEPARKGVFMGC